MLPAHSRSVVPTGAVDGAVGGGGRRLDQVRRPRGEQAEEQGICTLRCGRLLTDAAPGRLRTPPFPPRGWPVPFLLVNGLRPMPPSPAVTRCQ